MLLTPEKERGVMVGEGEDEFLLRFEKTKYMYVCGEGRVKVKERWGWEEVRLMEQEPAKRPNQKSRPRRSPLGQANHLRLPPISLIQLKSIYWEPKSWGDLSTEVENECDTALPLRKSHSRCESPRGWASGQETTVLRTGRALPPLPSISAAHSPVLSFFPPAPAPPAPPQREQSCINLGIK